MRTENGLDQRWECDYEPAVGGWGPETRDPSCSFESQVTSLTSRVLPPKSDWKKLIALSIAFVFVWSMCITPVMAETVNLQGGSIDVNVQDTTTNWNVTGNPVWNVPEFNVPQNSVYNIAGLGTGSSLALLVNGGSASNIFGTMNLFNLDFILQNIAGINIGSSAMINLSNASLIASTLPLNLSVTDFIARQYEFSGQGGFLMNEGKIVGSNADLVALVASAIENKGTIEVPMGTIALAAGNTVTVGISPDGLVSIGVDEATANSMGLSDQIKNAGTISAQGGRVVLTAKAIDGLFDKAINIEPSENATAVVVANDGTIEFVSNGDIDNEGRVEALRGRIEIDTSGDFENRGTLQAKGGTVESNTAGDFRSSGFFETDYIYQTGAAAYFSGTTLIHMGSRFTNLDNAVNIQDNVSGLIQDTSGIPNINFTGAVNLIGDTTLQADADGDNSGRIIMNGYALTGNNNDLTLYTGGATTLDGSISGVGVLTLNSSTTTDRTYTSTGVTFSVDTVKTNYHSIFSRSEGSGTALDPYMIYSVSNAVGGLQNIPTRSLSAYYKMANNIDASETANAGWDSGKGFDPIGKSLTHFTGNFDGNSKTITGLYISRSTTDNIGLFGYTSSAATLSNIRLQDVNISGRSYTGGLVGYNNGGTISNSGVTGSVSALGQGAGGLVGRNTGGPISNSYSTVSVSGTSSVGGLAGDNDGGAISNSYSTGDVTSTSIYVGGLVGHYYGGGSIANSYSTGDVSSSNDNVGGLVGYNDGGGAISNSFSTGSVTGVGSRIGGFMGYYSGAAITNCGWYKDPAGNATYAIGSTSADITYNVGKSGTDAGDVHYYATDTQSWFYDSTKDIYDTGGTPWNFTTVWRIYDGFTNPLLKVLLTALTVTANDFTKTYDSTTTVAGNGVTYSTTPSSELQGTSSFTSSDRNAGTYVGGITTAGLWSTQQGYDITYVSGDLTITKADLPVTGMSASNKVYDGTVAATLTGTAAITALLLDVVNLGGTGTGTFADKEVGDGKAVTVIGYTISGADAGNYNLVQPAGLTANITPAPEPASVTPAEAAAIESVDTTLVDVGDIAASNLPTITFVLPSEVAINFETGGAEVPIGDIGQTTNAEVFADMAAAPGGEPAAQEVAPAGESETTGEQAVQEAAPAGESETTGEQAAQEAAPAGESETSGDQGGGSSSKDDGKGASWRDVPMGNFFNGDNANKFLTDVRVIEGAVYVIDSSSEMSLLGMGDSMRVFRKKPKGSTPSKKVLVKPEVASAPEQQAGKAVSPIVIRQTKEGTRYGTLENPGKDVFVRSRGGDWKSATDGMVILPGDEVKTADKNSVEVLMDGGKVGHIEIKGGSIFRIQKAETDTATGDKTTILDLALGKILVKAEALKGNSRFEVKTPTALTGVRGTVFEVTVKEKGSM